MSHESIKITAEEMNTQIYRELNGHETGLTVRELASRISHRLGREIKTTQVWNGITHMRQNSNVHMISEQHGANSIHRITKNHKDVVDYARRRAGDWGSDLVRIAGQVYLVKDSMTEAQDMFGQLVEAMKDAREIMPRARREQYTRQVQALLGVNLDE